MELIKPESAEACIEFYNEHTAEIKGGNYDLEIRPEWVEEIEPEDLKLLRFFCPASRVGIAESEATPMEILLSLLDDEDANVRLALAKNAITPAETLITLSEDEESLVREAVVNNPNTPRSVLESFSQKGKGFEYIKESIAKNPSTPPDILESLADTEDGYWFVREAVARNTNTPGPVLELLSKDKRDSVREAVASNPRAPIAVLKTLSKEGGFFSGKSDIAKTAEENPNCPKGGCFIATAACGSYDEAEVLVLRKFRDERLLKSGAGRALVRLYYLSSPPVAGIIEKSEPLKKIIRFTLIRPLAGFFKKNL